jgi:glucose-1-phosphate thymidylyltransferase
MEAGNYIETIENRQGLKVCCPEEIAYSNHWIDDEQLLRLAEPLAKTGYGKYLQELVRGGLSR